MANRLPAKQGGKCFRIGINQEVLTVVTLNYASFLFVLPEVIKLLSMASVSLSPKVLKDELSLKPMHQLRG